MMMPAKNVGPTWMKIKTTANISCTGPANMKAMYATPDWIRPMSADNMLMTSPADFESRSLTFMRSN